MPTTGFCQRCKRLSVQLTTTALRLCPACPLAPPCGEFAHTYRAAHGDTPGVWICLACGQILGSVAISTDLVPAAQPPAPDWYC